MFVFSKIIWLVSQPLSLALLFCVLVLLAILLGLRRTSIALAVVPILILSVALFTTTGSVMVQALEDRFPRPQVEPADVRCMIVLGGGFSTEVATVRGGYNVNDAGDRFVEAFRLAGKYPQARILVSGGDGFISGGYLGDAVISERMFTALGLSPERLIQEPNSRTTFENAINTQKLLETERLSHCLLITSGFHMPRSVGIFRQLGMDIVPWVVDYRASGKESLRLDILQPETNVALFGLALKEWIGMIGYYAAGRTSALYPAPE